MIFHCNIELLALTIIISSTSGLQVQMFGILSISENCIQEGWRLEEIHKREYSNWTRRNGIHSQQNLMLTTVTLLRILHTCSSRPRIGVKTSVLETAAASVLRLLVWFIQQCTFQVHVIVSRRSR